MKNIALAHTVIDEHNADMADLTRQAWDKATTHFNERQAAYSQEQKRRTDQAVKDLRRALRK
jgi:hypothetical protein